MNIPEKRQVYPDFLLRNSYITHRPLVKTNRRPWTVNVFPTSHKHTHTKPNET